MSDNEHIEVSDDLAEPQVAEQAGTIAPVVWLIGKVQSGKSSIVAALTGTPKAQIGSGFKACTKTAEIYQFPEDLPLIRFLDTRGLGEANYDPSEDIEVARSASHCAIAVMRAMDLQQEAVLRVLSEVRRKDGNWPIVVAQTHLHEGYPPGSDHTLPYPFEVTEAGQDAPARNADTVHTALGAALAKQRQLFSRLPGSGPVAFVPIDITKPEDGYEPHDYGRHALVKAIEMVGSSALGAALSDVRKAEEGKVSGQYGLIVGYASAAAAADLVPLAAVVAVPAVQGKLLHALAKAHGLTWSRRRSLEFAGALGAGALTRYAAGFGIRQLAKLVPAYGQTIGATAAAVVSFTTTFALGKAADYYLARASTGSEASTAEIKEVWSKSLREAFDLARQRGLGTGGEAKT